LEEERPDVFHAGEGLMPQWCTFAEGDEHPFPS
jgi:hypothetical protein